MERIFNLLGVDVRSWYNSLIKGVIADSTEPISMSPSKTEIGNEDVLNEHEKAAIDSYYRSTRCLICKSRAEDGKQRSPFEFILINELNLGVVICLSCKNNHEDRAYAILCKMHEVQDRLKAAHAICVSCTLTPPQEGIMCESLDCPWLFVRKRAENDKDSIDGLGLQNLLEQTDGF